MRRQSLLILVTAATMVGCGRGNPPTVRCDWPPASSTSTDETDQRSVRADALQAEDLAIRYADNRNAPHSGHFQGFAAYDETAKTCMTALYAAVARQHQVSIDQVRSAVAHRPLMPDVLVLLPFAVVYALVAYRVVLGLRNAFPLVGKSEGIVAAIIAVGGSSLAFSFVGMLIADFYSVAAEIIRVGNGHLSYRTDRIPATQHHAAVFLVGVVVFLSIAVVGYRKAPREIRHRPGARRLVAR